MPSRRTHESINLRPLLHWEWATEGRDARLHLHGVPRGYLIWDTTGQRWINPDTWHEQVRAAMVNTGRGWSAWTGVGGDTRRRYIRGRGHSGSQIARQVEDWAVRRFKLYVPKPSDLFNRLFRGPGNDGVEYNFEPSRTWVPSWCEMTMGHTSASGTWSHHGVQATLITRRQNGDSAVRLSDRRGELYRCEYPTVSAATEFLNDWIDRNTTLRFTEVVRLPSTAAVNRLHGGDFDRITQERLESLPTPAGWAVGWH